MKTPLSVRALAAMGSLCITIVLFHSVVSLSAPTQIELQMAAAASSRSSR